MTGEKVLEAILERPPNEEDDWWPWVTALSSYFESVNGDAQYIGNMIQFALAGKSKSGQGLLDLFKKLCTSVIDVCLVLLLY